MSMPYFCNEHNRKSVPLLCSIVDEKTLQMIEKAYPNDSKIAQSICTIRSLPQMEYDSKKHSYLIHQNFNGEPYAYATVVPDTFTVVLKSNALSVPLPTLKACLKIKNVSNAIAVLKSVYPQERYFDRCNTFNALRRLEKGMDAQWSIEQYAAIDAFAQSDSCALFVRFENGKEGYLDKNGKLVNLSKAQIFDSEDDAKSAINRQAMFQYVSELQLVKLQVSVVGMGPIVSTNAKGVSWNGPVQLAGSSIYDVAALVQKRAIETALDTASVEQLDHARSLRDAPAKRKM